MAKQFPKRLARWSVRTATGRRVLLALALLAVWLGWMIAPPQPLREWTTTSWLPADWFLTSDRTCFVCLYHPSLASGQRYFVHGPVRLWELATGRERLTPRTDPHPEYTVILHIARDGSWLLTSQYQEGSVERFALKLWDTETGRERWSRANYPWNDFLDNYLVSPDERFVACRRHDGTSSVLTTANGQVLFALDDARPLAFAPDSQALATLGGGTESGPPATVTVWDMASGRPRTRLKLKQRFAGPVTIQAMAALSPDGHWLAVVLWAASDDVNTPKWVELWDLWTGERAAELDLGPKWDPSFSGLEFSPDGTLLVSPSFFGSPRAWDVRNLPPRAMDICGLRVLRVFQGMSIRADPTYPMYAPDGSRFVALGPKGDKLAFGQTAAPERAVIAHSSVGPVDRPDFAPDGQTLAVQHLATFLEPWEHAVNWLYQTAGRPAPFTGEERYELVLIDATTGAVRGHIRHFPADTHLLGFGPTGRTVWTMTHTPDEPADGVLRLQEWAVPSPWPPLWLLAVTALGVLLAVVDWRQSRPPREERDGHQIPAGVATPDGAGRPPAAAGAGPGPGRGLDGLGVPAAGADQRLERAVHGVLLLS